MKSQKGIGLVRLVILMIVLMLLVGVTTYVVVQDNGPIDRENENLTTNTVEEVVQ